MAWPGIMTKASVATVACGDGGVMSESGRRGRRKKELVPDGGPVTALALALRELRVRAGNPPYRAMAERVHVAHNLLSQADAGHRLPTEEALVAYVTACGGDVEEWKRRLHRARAAQAAMAAGPDPTAFGHAPPDPQVNNAVDGNDPTRAQAQAVRPGEPVDTPPPAGWRLAKRRLVLAGIAAVAALVTTVTVGWFVSPSDDATATGTDTSAPVSLPYFSHETSGPVGAERCRGAWVSSAVGDVQFLPCIAQQADGLVISAQVRNTGTVAVDVTVWVWLMRIDQDLLASRRYDLTRHLSTLRYCRFRLDHANEVTTCGPFRVAPPTERAWYAAASSGHFLHAARPPGWDSTGFAGTQSPMVHFGQRAGARPDHGGVSR